MGFTWNYPLVIQEFAMEHGPSTVDLPMKNGDFSYVKLPEGSQNGGAYDRSMISNFFFR